MRGNKVMRFLLLPILVLLVSCGTIEDTVEIVPLTMPDTVTEMMADIEIIPKETETQPVITEATEAETETTEAETETTERIETTETVTREDPLPSEYPETLSAVLSETIVYRGNSVTVSARGKPETEYCITVTYSSGKSKAKGLEPKFSDAEGNVSWTWKIGVKTNPGTYPVDITGGDEAICLEITVAVRE